MLIAVFKGYWHKKNGSSVMKPSEQDYKDYKVTIFTFSNVKMYPIDWNLWKSATGCQSAYM